MKDRRQVRQAFSSRAHSYEELIVVQRRVRERLLALLTATDLQPRVVIDVGAGTGALLKSLEKPFPRAQLLAVDIAPGMCSYARHQMGVSHAVAADAEQLPIRSESADLVVSSSAFQWLTTLEQAFREAARVLKPRGQFCFSLFGAQTLHELRSSYRQALSETGRGSDRTHSFPSLSDLRAALHAASFVDIDVWTETESELYPDVPDLLRAIRGIGANTASAPPASLGERRIMLKMMEIYRATHEINGSLPATYEVLYGRAAVKATTEQRSY